MLFALHDQFDQLTAAQWQGYANELHSLLHAHMHGHHIFLPSRSALATLSACNFLGQTCLAALSEIRAKIVDLEALSDRLPRLIVLYDPSIGHLSTDSARERSLEIRHLLYDRYLSPFKLLVENLNSDGTFWQVIFEVIAHQQFGQRACPRYDLSNGGGGALTGVATYLAGRKEPFFCIADSDKRSPFSPIGGTASVARQALIDGRWLSAADNGLSTFALGVGFHILSVREAENLIPPSAVAAILSEIGSPNYRIVERVAPSQPSLNDSDVRFYAHYDLKGAQRVDPPFHSKAEEEYFAELTLRIGNSPFPGVRDKLLQDFSEYFSGRQSIQRRAALSRQLVESPFWGELQELFWSVLSLGCVPQSKWF